MENTFTTPVRGLEATKHITGDAETARQQVTEQWEAHSSKRDEFRTKLDGLKTTDVAEVNPASLNQIPAEMLAIVQQEIAVREAIKSYHNGPASEATATWQRTATEALAEAEAKSLETLQKAGYKGKLLERTAREHESVVAANSEKRKADGYAGSLNEQKKANLEAIDQLRGQARKLIDKIVGASTTSLVSAKSMANGRKVSKALIG